MANSGSWTATKDGFCNIAVLFNTTNSSDGLFVNNIKVGPYNNGSTAQFGYPMLLYVKNGDIVKWTNTNGGAPRFIKYIPPLSIGGKADYSLTIKHWRCVF